MEPQSSPNQQANRQPQGHHEVKLIDQDPYGPSYSQSAIQYLPYRIGILVFAIAMIFLGQTNLPSNPVPCIEDTILDALQPVTDFYIANKGLGLTVVSIMQLLVDVELVGMLVYWFLRGNSLRYAIVMAVVGVSKMLLNVLFQTRLIPHSFNEQAFPSLVFGPNFKNTYFFSGVTCLLMVNLLELWQKGFKRLLIGQLVVLAYVVFVLLSARQNFFMDITTALVFSHYLFYFISDRIKTIDNFALSAYTQLAGPNEDNP